MKGIIVSGTARSGKSFLVKNIKENKHLITYKVDLLLIQSLRYKRPKNNNQLQYSLTKYAQKTRYIDAKKKKKKLLYFSIEIYLKMLLIESSMKEQKSFHNILLS